MIRVDDAGLRTAWIAQCLAKEPFGGIGVSQRGKQKVDRGSSRIDGPIQAAPATLDSNIGLIHTPGFVRRLVAAQSLLQFGTVALHPAPDRRMVRLQTALGEQLFDIAERERVPKAPAEGAENEFGCRPPPLKDRRSRYILHGLFTLAATPCQTCNTSILSTGASNSVGWITRQEGRIQGCSYRCGQCVQSEWLRNVRQPTFNDASMSD